MSGIKFVLHKDINRNKWDACIDQSKLAPIYGYSWYLDAICNHKWNALVLNDYEAVFPLPYKKKYGLEVVYQPFFCQQLGLFAREYNQLGMEDFLKSIPKKYVKVHLNLRSFGLDSNIDLPKRTNYILPLDKPYNVLRDQYSADCKKNLRKAAAEPIEFIINQDYKTIIEMYKQAWGSLNPHVKELHYAQFGDACHAAIEKEMLVCITSVLNDEILGGAIFLKNSNYLHYVCAAPTVPGRKFGIMHSIIDFAIQQFSEQNLYLDFEGSENENVAAFYLKFNPVHGDYWVYTRNCFGLIAPK